MATYVLALLMWALLHASVLAAVLALALEAWERRVLSPASARYWRAMTCLGVVALAFVADVALTQLSLSADARRGLGETLIDGVGPMRGVALAFDRAFGPLLLFGLVWSLGVTRQLFGIVRDMHRMRRLRRRSGDQMASAACGRMRRRIHHRVQPRVRALAHEAGLREPPVLVISASSDGPFVTGRQPGVLVWPMRPMPDVEADALILHELAHIVRRDFEWSWLAAFVRVLFWFHPGVRSLAETVSVTREECCDAFVACRPRGAGALARALVRLAEQRLEPASALGANGSSLVMRVHRLLASERADEMTEAASAPAPAARTSWGDRSAVLLSLAASIGVALVGCVLAWQLAPRSDRLAIASARARAVPAREITIHAHDDAGPFSLTLLNGRVAAATVAGVPFDAEALGRKGDRIVLPAGRRGEPSVMLALGPAGSIRWTSRPAMTGRRAP